MDFISNQTSQIQEMLQVLNINSIEELFKDIPAHLLKAPIREDDGLSESEGMQWIEKVVGKNTFDQYEHYLGGGAYQHHVPALVGAVCAKSEFLTAYTPYQAEMSQGLLQLIFEFQSAVCALTGMDVSNASLYDGASACAEACLMALRQQKGRNKIVIAQSLNPHYAAVVEQYVRSHQTTLASASFQENGLVDLKNLEALVDDQTAAILLQSPNFFGVIESVKEIVTLAKKRGSLVILCANPLSYGLFASAKELGVDIAVGDCQPFGLALQYGGPYVGYIACNHDLVRQLPGRVVGETVDSEGKRGFVLTLQAREQHIRREKATSNICTNQALAALAALVAMLWYGKEGVKRLSLTNYQRAAYLKECLEQEVHLKTFQGVTCFNEFVVEFPAQLDLVFKVFRQAKIEPGIAMQTYFPQLKNALLISVTEMKNKAQLDHFVELAKTCVAT